MKPGNDYVYVTQCDDTLFMWLDEPVLTNGIWIGRQPYVNSILHEKVVETISSKKLNEPEIIMF